MELLNEVTVAAPLDEVWRALCSFEHVAACIPGARLDGSEDGRTFRGSFQTRFGPVKLEFVGTVVVTQVNAEAHRLTLDAAGTERKGRGSVSANVTVDAASDGSATRIMIASDVVLNGKAAQLSRGLLPKAARDLSEGFAACLAGLVESSA